MQLVMQSINDINFCSKNKFCDRSFIIRLATNIEKKEIMQQMQQELRQTMNLRLMPKSQLILLIDNLEKNPIIGWMGLDFQYNKIFPETFSLFITPRYRGLSLSLLLKHAAYSMLQNRGIIKSYSRMEAGYNQKLIQYNLDSGFYRILSTTEMDRDWQALCLQCELFQKNCKTQIYLEANVSKIFNNLNQRIKSLTDVKFQSLLSEVTYD